MKISAQEEYGLRILVRIARFGNSEGLTIPEISEAEGMSNHNVAKLCRLLRLADFIISSRGKSGGYMLSRPASEIMLNEVLEALGGRMFTPKFCGTHTGIEDNCFNTGACSIQFLWQKIQNSVDNLLSRLTLEDLIAPPHEVQRTIHRNASALTGS